MHAGRKAAPMNIRPAFAALAALAAAALFSACSGGGGMASSCSASVARHPLANSAPVLLYPEPNATAVPDNVGVLIYAATSPQTITLSSGTSMVATQATPVPSPLPSPMASAPPGDAMFAVGFGTLGSAKTYVAFYTTAPAVSGCGTTSGTIPFGQFFTL